MAKLNAPQITNLQFATPTYERQYVDQLNNSFRLYFKNMTNIVSTLIGNEGGQYLSFPYGAFQDNTTQTAAATSTAYAVKLGTTDFTNSVVVKNDPSGNPTYIVVDETGVYNLAFSLQLQKTTANKKSAWIWIRVNGTDVADSATRVALQGNSAELVAAWNFFLNLEANDYVQLMWAVEDTGITILHEAATAFCPAIPSVILTMNFISVPPTNSSITA